MTEFNVDNITLRKPKMTSSPNDITIISDQSTLFDTTMLSLPNTSIEEHKIKDLIDKMNTLEEKLRSANKEIERLSLANLKLNKELQISNKMIELYKKIGTPDNNNCTPASLRKLKTQANQLDTSDITAFTTPTKNMLHASPIEKLGPLHQSNKPYMSSEIGKPENIGVIPTHVQENSLLNQKEKESSPYGNEVKSKYEMEFTSKSASKTYLESRMSNLRDTTLNTKHHIIIIADQMGRLLRPTLEKLVEPKYTVTSILKPGAKLCHVVSSHSDILKNLNKNDYIIVLGGTNDRTPNECRDSVNTFLINSTNTNVIICQTPYNNSFYVGKINGILKLVSCKHEHAYYLDLNYGGYIPKGKMFTLYSARNILREIIRFEYKFKLNEYKHFVKKSSTMPKPNFTTQSTQTDMNNDIVTDSKLVINSGTITSNNNTFFRI